MALPARQQVIIDQIERALIAADPVLKARYAVFRRLTQDEAMPVTEVIFVRPWRRMVAIGVMLLSVLGVLVLFVRTTSNDCPGLSSDQVVASASVRYAACTKETDVWSRGAR